MLFEARDKGQWANAARAQNQVGLLITARLRRKAAAIPSGDEPAILPSPAPEPSRKYYKRIPERHVLFLRPVRYTRAGRHVLCNAWMARVLVPVADTAIEQGVAVFSGH